MSAVTFGLFLGVAGFYFYLKKPSALRLAAAGLAAGICLGTKHSGILLFPMLLFLALAELLPLRDPDTRKFAPDLAKRALHQAASLAAIVAISLVVLWSFYGFRYAARPAGLSVNPPLPEFARQMGHNSSAIVLGVARWHLLPGILSVRGRGYFLGGNDPDRDFRKILSVRAVVLFSVRFHREVYAGVPRALLSGSAVRHALGESNFAGRCSS